MSRPIDCDPLRVRRARAERAEDGLHEAVDPPVVVEQQEQRDRHDGDGGPNRQPQAERARTVRQVTGVGGIGGTVREPGPQPATGA